MTYNLTLLSNATGLGSLVKTADTYSMGFLVPGLSIAIVIVVIMMSIRRYSFTGSVALGCFVGLVTGIILWSAGMIPILLPLFYLAMIAITMFFGYLFDR
jgi:hypothetical protein